MSDAAGGLIRGAAGECCCCREEEGGPGDVLGSPPGNAGSGGRGRGRLMLPVLVTEVVEATDADLDKAGEGIAPTVAKRPGMVDVDGIGGVCSSGTGGEGCDRSAGGPGGLGRNLREMEALPWLG